MELEWSETALRVLEQRYLLRDETATSWKPLNSLCTV